MFSAVGCIMHLKEFVIELENLATDMKSEALLDNKNEFLNLNNKEVNMEQISVVTLNTAEVNGKEEKNAGISEINRRSGKCFRFFCFLI